MLQNYYENIVDLIHAFNKLQTIISSEMDAIYKVSQKNVHQPREILYHAFERYKEEHDNQYENISITLKKVGKSQPHFNFATE